MRKPANAISNETADGKYRPGTQLPGTHELTREYGASNTIRRAVNLLTDWGVLNEARQIRARGPGAGEPYA